MATLYLPYGKAEEIYPTDDKGLTLDDFHRLIAPDLDFVYLAGGRFALVVDDFGVRKKLPRNDMATFLYQQDGGSSAIYGPALFCHLSEPGTEYERWT